MPGFNDSQEIFRRSLDELKAIAVWLDTAEKSGKIKPVTFLIGGWAVYFYNPWYGSIDIDLITNSDVKNRMMRHLIDTRGYGRDSSDPPGTVVKYIRTGGGNPGEIRLDFISRSRSYPFEGINESLDFENLCSHTISQDIGDGIHFRVPDRSLLLIYKLKAIHDRRYRLTAGRSNFPEREASKLEKDYCDVLALLDREQYSDDLDIGLLAEELSKYGFLRDIIESVPTNIRAIGRYNNMSQTEVKSICKNLLSLTKT